MAKLVYFWAMLPLGFTFVNVVNLQNERKNPFLDNHMSYKSFIQTVTLVGPIFYLVSCIVVLRGTNDLVGYCDRRLSEDFNDSIAKAYADPTPSCHLYTDTEIF